MMMALAPPSPSFATPVEDGDVFKIKPAIHLQVVISYSDLVNNFLVSSSILFFSKAMYDIYTSWFNLLSYFIRLYIAALDKPQ